MKSSIKGTYEVHQSPEGYTISISMEGEDQSGLTILGKQTYTLDDALNEFPEAFKYLATQELFYRNRQQDRSE